VGMEAKSEAEEPTLEELRTLLTAIKNTDGIKKIQDAITAVCSGEVTVKGSESLALKQEPVTGELHVKTV